MFAKFLHLLVAPVSFYKDDRLQTGVLLSSRRPDPTRRAERWIIAGWVLIVLKCLALWWLIDAYQVPIHPLWLIGPTVMFGALATAVYFWRD